MGLFDTYEPDPPLQCPVCRADLAGWQGKDGPNALFVWRQNRRHPIDQDVPEESRLDRAAMTRFDLPSEFEIYTNCCGGRFFVAALCHTVDGMWSSTTLVTAENAAQRSDERKQDFKARRRWLEGRARRPAPD
jgi:hypothetical protein